MFSLTLPVVESGVIALAYAIGCIATGYYLVKLKTGKDLRELGTRSTGAKNVGRVLGKPWFVVVLLCDVAKGALAIAVPRVLHLGPGVELAALLALVIGHIWPIQLGFRGGKGMGPTLGAMLVISPQIVLAYTVVAAAFYVGLRSLTMAGLIALISLPVIPFILKHPARLETPVYAILAAILLFAHRNNIHRHLQPAVETPAATPPANG